MASHNIFLSYSSTDKDLVTRICDDLRANGLTVYVDDGSASGTPTLNRVINDRMRSANVLISLLSPEARASDTLVQKLAFAASLKKPLYLILARGDENTAIPPGYSAYPLIDIRRDYNRISTELIPKLFSALDIQDAIKIAPKLKPVAAVEKPAASPESQPSPTERQEATYDFSKPLKYPRRTKRQDRTRDLALLFLVLISLYFLWRALAPLNEQLDQYDERQAEVSQSLAESDAQIAFYSERDGNGEIYLMSVNGSNVVNLTNHEGGDYAPAWSPDGARIAFQTDRDGELEVYVMNADGSNQINLTNNSAEDAFPSWSPDGTRLAFMSHRDGDHDIYIMNVDGSNPVNLTNNSAYDYYPVWSPDGARIAFVSDRGGRLDIYVMDGNGSNPVNLTNGTGPNASPAWSPDSARIVFMSNRDNDMDIYVIDADGSNLSNLTVGSGAEDALPSWSPDSEWIAFTSDRDGNNEIYVLNTYSVTPFRLTTNDVDDRHPAWRP